MSSAISSPRREQHALGAREALAGVDAAKFREGMRSLVGAVNVITARLADGSAIGLSATAVCSVSAEPATLLACINQSTTLGRAITHRHRFAVNVLAGHHEPLARAFGGLAGLDQQARFGLGTWREVQGEPPSLVDALVTFICRAADIIECGSHFIVIGHVEDVILPHPESSAATNLVYCNGTFRRFPDAI